MDCISLLAIIWLAACAQQGGEESAAAAVEISADASSSDDSASVSQLVRESDPAAAASAVDKQAQAVPGQLASQAGTAGDPARHFKVTADARFQVDDVYAVGNRIEDAEIAAGGFVLDNAIGTDVHDVHLGGMGDGTRLRLSQIRTSGTITVRVPAA